MSPWYTSPLFVVPVMWICFLCSILWASQPWTYGTSTHQPHSEEVDPQKAV